MVEGSEEERQAVDYTRLPIDYPTHLHQAQLWEALGRTVATYGFLEEVLGKAIFAFTGMREVPPDQIEEALEKWLPTLEKALSDALGGLIDAYGKAVREHGSATIINFNELLGDLRASAVIRNVICHGSWRRPDAAGRALPFLSTEGFVFSTRLST